MGYSKHELCTIKLYSLKKLSSYTPTSPSAIYLCPRGGRCGEVRLYTAISRKVVGKSARDNPERHCGWF